MFSLRSTTVDCGFCPIALVLVIEILCPGVAGNLKNKAGKIN